jgi:hypothetical protein
MLTPGPNPLVVLHYEPLEYKNNNANKLSALLVRAPDARVVKEVGLSRLSMQRYACILAESHMPRVRCCRLTRLQLHRLNRTPVQHLGASIPMRTTPNVRSSCELLYKTSACPPLCKPVSTIIILISSKPALQRHKLEVQAKLPRLLQHNHRIRQS